MIELMENYVECPACKEMMREDASVCPHCGRVKLTKDATEFIGCLKIAVWSMLGLAAVVWLLLFAIGWPNH